MGTKELVEAQNTLKVDYIVSEYKKDKKKFAEKHNLTEKEAGRLFRDAKRIQVAQNAAAAQRGRNIAGNCSLEAAPGGGPVEWAPRTGTSLT